MQAEGKYKALDQSSQAKLIQKPRNNTAIHSLQSHSNHNKDLEEFLNILDKKDVDEEKFYKYLDFEQEEEDCAINSTPARSYSTYVTFDDDRTPPLPY